MNGYEKRTAAKKAAIIDAAREMFAKRGMRDVSISEIAKGANVSQVSIYNYFYDKNALAKEAFAAYIEAEIAAFEQILGLDIPFEKKTELIVQGKIDMAGQTSSSHFNEKALGDKALQQVFQEAVSERAAAVYEKFIELGKREGYIDMGIPTDAIMHYFMASMAIFSQSEYMKKPAEYKIGMINLFLYGIIGKHSSENSNNVCTT